MFTNAYLLRFLLACGLVVALLWSVRSQELDGSTATFYGGYHRVNLPKSDRELDVTLTFKTAHSSGVLAIARVDDTPQGYLAIGFANGYLYTTLKRQRHRQRFDVGPVTIQDWQNLTVRIQDTSMNISLNSDSSLTHELTSSISFKDIYFGGAHTFFAPIYTDLNLTEYFIGCVGNISVNEKAVSLAVPQYGIQPGCCPNPIPALWCFNSETAYFGFRSILNHDRFSHPSPLVISFRIQSHSDGILLYSHDSFNIVIEIFEGSLFLIANSWEVGCPGSISDQDWHDIHMEIAPTYLLCRVDNRENTTLTSHQGHPSLAAPFYIGGLSVDTNDASLSTFLENLHLQPSQNTFNSFEGCIQKFQFNGIDLFPSVINASSPNISEACPYIDMAYTCSLLNGVNWEDAGVQTSSLTVDEGSQVTLTTSYLDISLPANLDTELRKAIHNAARFDVVEGPMGGVFFAWAQESKITTFLYEDVANGLVVYRHGGGESVSDFATLMATFECNDVIFFTTSYSTLDIVVQPTNDDPEVLRQKEITMAVGTRVVITPDIITITDPDAAGPEGITIIVQSIDSCNQCGGDSAGRIERTQDPGFEHIYFTQEDVNNGDIAFQHFSSFGTATVKIYLSVSDETSGIIYPEITVNPYEGHINLTTNNCLFAVEGTAVILKPRHLNATTDFEDQDPILTYDILTQPQHGQLETIWKVDLNNESTWQWVSIGEVPRNADSFTQHDIDEGVVRYVHDNSTHPVAESDSFRFSLRSTNLTGLDESVFCVQVISYETLQQPSIVVEVGEIIVAEGGTLVLNETVLNTSLSPPILIDWLEEEIGIEQLGITFIISPESAPTSGELHVNGLPLVNNSFALTDLLTGHVTYTHNGSEIHNDSFSFYAEAQSAYTLPIRPPDPSETLTAPITVLPVNDHKPEIIQREYISPPEGGWVTITSDMLEVLDADLPGDDLTISLRRKGSDPANGFFAYADRADHEIREFTMDDIYEKKVVFKHTLDRTQPLGYTQSLLAEDGVNDSRDTIRVEAFPLNVTATAVPLPASTCIATLDATVSPLSFPMERSMVHIVLEDGNGHDPNRVPDVIVGVITPPTYGVVHVNTTGSMDSFNMMDLDNRRIEYHFLNQMEVTHSDTFYLEFRYGHGSSGPVPFQVCINPIPIPSLVHSNPISLAIGSIATIETVNLFSTDSRDGVNTSLEYRIATPPLHGFIFDQQGVTNNQSLPSFTQQNINDGHIAYQHEGSSNELSDSFTFYVCTPYACTELQEFTISLYVAHLTITNTGFTVLEGGRFTITTSELNAIAPPGYDVTLQVPKAKKPKHGTVNREALGLEPVENTPFFFPRDLANGYVVYVHDDGEDKTLMDSFEFTAVALPDPTFDRADLPPGVPIAEQFNHSGVVSIRIIPVNDNPPIVFKFTDDGLVLVEGSTAVLTSDVLSAHDIDSNAVDEELQYELVTPAPIYGDLYFGDNPYVRISRWTEGDLRSGRVFYKHTKMANKDFVAFSLTDGGNLPVYDFFIIDVKEIILTSGSRFPFLKLKEGSAKIITQDYLNYTASNDDVLTDADYVYTITEGPYHGQLEFNGTRATQFTQQDLLSNGLVYEHDHSNTVGDTFTFVLAVPARKDASETYQFEIRIDPVDDDPPEVTYVRNPMFVEELMFLYIGNSSNLQIIDSDSNTATEWHKITCTIIEYPQYGIVQRNLFQGGFTNTSEFTLYDLSLGDAVRYKHTFRGHWGDHFVFNLTDGDNDQNVTYRANITILPQVIEMNVTSISVIEGNASLLGPGNFQVEHPYLREVPGSILVSQAPQHGVLINNHTGEQHISSFTTDDLARGFIFYQHNSDDYPTDQFEFDYGNAQPVSYERRSLPTLFQIHIIPVNDQPPVLTTQSLSIWVGETITLNQTHLHATDKDTPPEDLVYTVTFTVDGRISYSQIQGSSIHNFTQADVNAERIMFVHNSGLEGDILLEVTDGVQVTHGLITVFAQQLKFHAVTNSPPSVPMGKRVNITHEYLYYITTDVDDSSRPILYEVRELHYGKIILNSTIETTWFTQSDINDNRVAYVHTDLDVWEPREILLVTLSTPLADSLEVTFVINIDHPSSPFSELAVNDPIELMEGGVVCLSESVLDARNLRYSVYKNYSTSLEELAIVYHLMDEPRHGSLRLANERQTEFRQSDLPSGSVCYHHDSSESMYDSLPLKVTIVSPGVRFATYYTSVNITIHLVNDEAPQLVPTLLNMMVVEGFPVVIEGEDLEVTDEDNLPEEIRYVLLKLPENGDLFIGGKTLQIDDWFTQADINDHRVKFVPSSVAVSEFVFTFSDGLYSSVENVSFTLTVVGHTLDLLWSRIVTYQQNKQGRVITSELLNTSTNGHREETRFVVKERPEHGRLEYPSGQGFTQSDLDAGRVTYTPTTMDSHQDHFTVDIKNKHRAIDNVTIQIQVLVWGQVRDDVMLDLESRYSASLPENMLDLDDLQTAIHQPPMIEVFQPPKYGYLEMMYAVDLSKRSAPGEPFAFRYDELQNGWVHYRWNPPKELNLTTDSLDESFIVVVLAEGMQPGEAVINLAIHPPSISTPAPTMVTESPTTDVITDEVAAPTSDSENGFPTYALVPILGIFFILILMIVVIVVFCLTQQKRIQRKWQSKSTPTAHPYPWSIQPNGSTRPPMPQNYDADPADSEEDHENEMGRHLEAISEYSETGTRHSLSPVAHRSSPLHPYPPISRPRIGRIRSNVSISLSHRTPSHRSLSRRSDYSEESSYLPRHVPQQHLVHPIPIRPMVCSPVYRSSREDNESGYLSTLRSHMSSAASPMPQNGGLGGTDTPSESSVVSSAQPSVVETTTVVANPLPPQGGNGLNICDPDLLKLFRSSNPVLKKEEYWV